MTTITISYSEVYNQSWRKDYHINRSYLRLTIYAIYDWQSTLSAIDSLPQPWHPGPALWRRLNGPPWRSWHCAREDFRRSTPRRSPSRHPASCPWTWQNKTTRPPYDTNKARSTNNKPFGSHDNIYRQRGDLMTPSFRSIIWSVQPKMCIIFSAPRYPYLWSHGVFGKRKTPLQSSSRRGAFQSFFSFVSNVRRLFIVDTP